jgi:hypothetical protein
LNVKRPIPIDAKRGLGGFRVTYAVLVCNMLFAVHTHQTTIYFIQHRGTTAVKKRTNIVIEMEPIATKRWTRM